MAGAEEENQECGRESQDCVHILTGEEGPLVLRSYAFSDQQCFRCGRTLALIFCKFCTETPEANPPVSCSDWFQLIGDDAPVGEMIDEA